MLMEKLKILWRGEIPLVKTFWLYCMGVYLAFDFFFLLFLYKWAMYSLLIRGDLTPLFILVSIILFIYSPYIVVVLVGIWRSSGRYEGSVVWGILAKLFSIFIVLRLCKNILAILGVLVALLI